MVQSGRRNSELRTGGNQQIIVVSRPCIRPRRPDQPSGFASDHHRLPLWGLGCAGGAVGLARAVDYCRAYPEHHVLLVALECCSLTFMAADVSKTNLIATALFADGAAAALIAGDGTRAAGPRVLATRSQLFPDSYRIRDGILSGRRCSWSSPPSCRC
jgi:hypothetical protein